MTKSKGILLPRGHSLLWLEANAFIDTDECIFWPFRRNKQGYGYLKTDGKLYLASRKVCEKRNGPPPTDKHEAAHSCGKGHLACVNAKHIRWATPTENNHDRKIHGTDNAGERHGMAVLTDDKVLAIIAARHRGEIMKTIARQFGVSRPTVSLIVNRKTWRHLEAA